MNTQQPNANRQPNAGPSLVEGRGTPTSGGPTGGAKASPINIPGTAAAGTEAGPLSTVLCSLLALFLLATFAPRAEAVEATNYGGYVTNVWDGPTNWTYHIFTNAGAGGMKFRATAAGGTVQLLVVAGGASGGSGSYHGAGGGAGGLIYTNYTVTHNTDYNITVGTGGVAQTVSSSAGNNGQDSKFGSLTAIGGGGGGAHTGGGNVPAPNGKGSGGGGGRGGSGGTGTPGQGCDGGLGVNNNLSPPPDAYGTGGGGGAGTNGANGTYGGGGNGGDGLYFVAFTNWGDTNNPGWFAGGGGGSYYSSGTAGSGGKGGGGNGGNDIATAGKDGQPNTGGGGGGPKSHVSASSGAGGSGIVIVRYESLAPVMIGGSGGDIFYPTNLSGTVYYVHIFTNTVGTNYFTPTRALNVEYLVIGGGGGGNTGKGGGGGAGGYRCSVQGELSGSNSTAEAVYPVTAGVAYPVVVGVGGAGFSWAAAPGQVNKGGDSWFTNIVAIGGGVGKERNCLDPEPLANGGSGGGGGYANPTGGVGRVSEGFPGGDFDGVQEGGGGGGAGGPGIDGNVATYGGDGGTGLVSSITGVAVGRAGGGQGAHPDGTSSGAALCGGGTQSSTSGAPGTGGGGASYDGGTGCNGGSGIVVLRYVIPPPPSGTVILLR